MSKMYQLLTKLPSSPIINAGRMTPVTRDEIARLTDIRSMVEDEIAGLLSGITAIGEMLGNAETRISQEQLVNLGWLVSIAANTVDGLRFIESQAGAILLNHASTFDT